MFKFKMHEEDLSLLNVFQKRNFKLPVDPIEQGISCFEQDGSGQKSQCDKEASTKKAEPSFNHQTISRRYILENALFQNQPKMILPFKE